MTLESQFGGIAQRWAASHQDIIPAKLHRVAFRNGVKKKMLEAEHVFEAHLQKFEPSPGHMVEASPAKGSFGSSGT